MTSKATRQEKLQSIAGQCKDIKLINSLIDQYQQSTKSAVENILNMCTAVSETSRKYKEKEINEFDLIYFCSQIGLDRKSSTFRKYRQIGDHADRFVQHMNTLPSTYTVLFQITTLDPDKFEEMIEKGQITPSLSLEQYKKLINPTAVKTNDPHEVNFKVEFNMKQLSEQSKEFLTRFLRELSDLKDIDTVIPEKYQRILNFKNPVKS